MKKLAILCLSVFLIALFIVAGCKKPTTTLSDELTGTWTVYKYLLYNTDQTQAYQNQHVNYMITFTNNGKYTESYTTTIDTGTSGTPVADSVNGAAGTYTFANNNQEIVLTGLAPMWVDTAIVLTTYTRTYTIFDLTGADLQLVNDTSRIYLSKKH